MEYRVLGPLEVLDASGHKISLGGAMQQSVLAELLLRAGRTVTIERLVDQLWDKPPVTAVRTVQAYVSRLRRELPDGAIESRPSGYMLVLDGANLDVETFERRAQEGHEALAAGEYERAASLLREALGLWRGPALAGLGSEALRREAERLEELRLSVLEDRIDADLGSGRHGEIVPELTALVAEHSFREHLRAQLMRALYRAGRPGDALALYREGRHLLVEDLGMEPGQELRELEQAILRQDQELEAPEGRRPADQAKRSVPAPAQLTGPRPPEVRKMVTVLFCDVVGSTALGETTDPEVLRARLARYFERMRAIVERHEGTVEKFIGDAVMAVFGVPVAHEDDAVRACRAAIEMRESFPEIGIEGRIGLATGEVVAGTEERLATGDAVNVAGRLQQAAEPGEVLVAEATLHLVREAAEVEGLEPLALKGKTELVAAHRLLRVHEVPRRHKGRFVGREREVAAIHEAWQRAQAEQLCELFTIAGDAGVGKSRLVAEALAAIEARVFQGRCLPYGDGITYSPVVEVVRQLDALPSDPAAAASLRSLLRETEEQTTAVEIAWAFRKLLEEQAPLVVVVDDIQWAEEALLDLIEYAALLSSGAAVLLLCLERLDLAERRPTWPVSLKLEPLTKEDVEELLPPAISSERRKEVVRASGGNPLFVTELVAMAGETQGELAIPPTLRALLAARLDQLEPDERSALQCAAVEGEIFHRGGVQTLAPVDDHLTSRLTSLVRKELIRPDEPRLPHDDAFRFRHLLIRDTAYESLPKERRADLHERLADWLEHAVGERLPEFEGIVGYHLEQAHGYHIELGSTDARAAALARRASQRLESAGRRALARSLPEAIGLLERAVGLLAGDDPNRAELLVELLAAQIEAGRLDAARSTLDEAHQVTSRTDERTESRLCLQEQLWKLLRVEEEGPAEARSVVDSVVPVFENCGYHRGLAEARNIEALSYWNEARAGSAAAAWEKAASHAQRAGDEHEYAVILTWLASSLVFGPTPVSDGIRRCQQLLREVSGDLAQEAAIRGHLASLHAKDGRFDRAHELLAASAAVLADLGLSLNAAPSPSAPVVETLAGNHAAAERSLRTGYDALGEMSEKAFRSTTAALLARAILAQGRDEEAAEFARQSTALAASGDVFTHVLLQGIRARIEARRGDIVNAEALAREAVQLAQRSDFLDARGDALLDLASVLRQAGQHDEARRAVSEAIGLFARKGNKAAAKAARSRLAEFASV